MFSISNNLQSISRRINSRDIFLFILTSITFLLTRLGNLLSLPIFSDEGIYLNWAKIASYDPAWRFISLTDGKQPLQTWGTMLLIRFFPDQILIAGRLFSVASGLVAMIGIFFLCRYLWGKTAGWVGVFCYLFTPYFIFYDRISLVDSAVNASFIWILFFSLMLAKSKRLDIALIFGLISGIGSLTKSSVILFIALSFFGFLWSEGSIFPLNKKKLKNIADYLFLFCIGFGLGMAIYQLQRLSPFFHYISEKNTTFILTPKEFLQNPFALIANNLKILPLYVFWESGWFLPFLGIIGYFVLAKREKSLFQYLLIWLVVPSCLIIGFNRVLFPRYVIFLCTILILPAIYLLARLNNTYKTKLFYLSCLFIFAIGSIFSIQLQYRPSTLSLPPIDRGQYVTGETAVWGADKLMQEVRNIQNENMAIIFAEGNFGLVADVLQVFIKKDDHIQIRGFWPLNQSDIINASKNEATNSAVFAVFPHRQKFTPDWPMKLIKKYDKPESNKSLYLFQVLPQGVTPEMTDFPQ